MLKLLLVESAATVPADSLRAWFEVTPVLSYERLLENAMALRPDLVVVDSSPKAVRAVRRLMSEHPVPVVMLAEDPTIFGRTAIKAGAVSAFALPHSPQGVEDLAIHLKLMSGVLVFRKPLRHAEPRPAGRGFRVLGVVASTGGPTAVAEVLAELGDTQAVILVVQHMAPDSLPGFVEWLAGRIPLPVHLAHHQERTQGGHVYVAPPDAHMEWNGDSIVLTDSDPVGFQRPSGTVLFASLARHAGPSAVGVMLTGLGEDGAVGLLDLRLARGFTLVEAESTAVAFEMPAAALRLNAALETWPLPALARRLKELLKPSVLEYPSA